METVIVTGPDVIDYATDVFPRADVVMRNYGFCCDSGNFDREHESDREDLFFSLLNWHRDPEKFECEFVEDERGNPNFKHPVVFRILAEEQPETNVYEYTVYPNGYVAEIDPNEFG